MSDNALAKWRGKNVAISSKNVQMVQALTLRENIELARRYGTSESGYRGTLENLNKAANISSQQMSGGQRRRLFAVTMVRDPANLSR